MLSRCSRQRTSTTWRITKRSSSRISSAPNSSSFAPYSSRASDWNSSMSASRVISPRSSRSSAAVISVW